MGGGLLQRWVRTQPASHSDVLVPKRGMFANELPHHLDAARILKYVYNHPATPKQLFLSHEGDILSHHNVRYAVEQDRTRTHGARRKCRVEDALSVHRGGQPARMFEGIHLPVEDGTVLLDTPVVTATEDLALMHYDGADRNASFGK